MSRISFFLLFFFAWNSSICLSQEAKNKSVYDSVIFLRSQGNNKKLNLQDRVKYANRAVSLSIKLKSDTTLLKSRRVLSTALLYSGDYDGFRLQNRKTLLLAEKLSDTLELGQSMHNLGWYYYQKRTQNDSAYFYLTNAIELYDKVDRKSSQVEILQNLSEILQYEKDYLGSEENAIRGLKLLSELPKTESNLISTYQLYTNLGIISLELNRYDESIDYHQKALEIAKKRENGFLPMLYSINNEAFVHREKGDKQTAQKLYREILEEDNLFNLDPTFYALVSDNLAYTQFLNGDKDYDKLEKIFRRAYKIADSLEDPITKLATTIDIAHFYKAQSKIDSSLHYAKETYDLAKLTSENDMLLESLLLLSELKPGEEGKKYLNEHIKLSDSLLQNERGFRNKSARVQFETDQIEQENERIATQRFWLLIVSIVLLVTLFLLYIIISQRTKNKELQFEKDQQQANEEIYNLMLSQQDKVDEARAQEKKRISEEIHDGVLGRLFGTRLSLDTFNFKDGPEAAKTRLQYINDLKDIEQDIRKISHDLNTDFVAGSGFMDIVETLVQNQTQAYNLKYEFYYSDDINWEVIPNKTKIHIYRILQESMQNIYKHAEATHIKISFELKNNVILMTIKDDGKGFVFNKSKKGIGLKNINSRVEEVNGLVEFDSVIDEGTTISIKIPFSNNQL
ncbi:sensor histidine kinase [Subsaxibacter sp. CAU 1640]|uniref:tetratricopeptide repeat-containing sensor histidine kinase n=1 Tax=Subsaxibacter sp. CAU 1640 TaxID=2933271 RepID=UPI002002A0B2|nr:sensor histidine kinase [Subsaxibacter sp. CAU 1640]MCK7589128.1 sensor histidine kinase [Subsaxibacter sp. CAU 1640]